MLAEIEGGRADQVADVLDEEQHAGRRRQLLQGMAHHVGIEMADPARVDLHRRHAGSADPLGVVLGFLIALDDGHGGGPRESGGRRRQEGRLAGAGAREKIEGAEAEGVEAGPVGRRIAVVLGQNVLLDAVQAKVAVIVPMPMPMPMPMVVAGLIVVLMAMTAIRRRAADPHLAFAATAYAAHVIAPQSSAPTASVGRSRLGLSSRIMCMMWRSKSL